MPFVEPPGVFRRKKRKARTALIDLAVSRGIYQQLRERASEDGVSESNALLQALTRGMDDYWLHVAAYEKERFELIEKLFERSKRDAELLDALICQNRRFRDILRDNTIGSEPDGQQGKPRGLV